MGKMSLRARRRFSAWRWPRRGNGEGFLRNLDEYLASQLPHIDELLFPGGTPLSQRPHKSACFIVEHCIARIENETKEGFLVKPWFGVLLSKVIDWYEKTYGDALQSNPGKCHTAVVLIRSSPIALDVPLTVVSPLGEDGTRWLTFACDILPGEEPLKWLIRPPVLSLLEDAQLRELTEEITQISRHVRQVRNGVLTISKEHRNAAKHAKLVLPHLGSAAQNILMNAEGSFSTSIWEANFAAENALKCYLHQAKCNVPKAHDVRALAKPLGTHPHPQEIAEALAAMPSGAEAVGYRYGERATPSITLAINIYRSALVLCSHFVNAHPRQYRLNNASFQIKFPPMPALSSRNGL